MLTCVASSAGIIGQPGRNATKQLPTMGKVVCADSRSFDVYIAFGLRRYAVFKPLKHTVDQLLDRSTAVIAGDFLPAEKRVGQVPLDNMQGA